MKIKASLLFISSLIFCACYSARNDGATAALKIQGTNYSIQIKRVHIHAFLAEYDRFLILTANGKSVAKLQIATDTGGYSRANVFSTKSGSVFLVQDLMGKYEVDVSRQEIKKMDFDCKSADDGNFIGAFDIDESEKWKFISVWERRLLSVCSN